ncbi:unnamed protein product [Oikopleura dioica]|uniref:Uncharacterized protein n=1 Tax=Oikopleura dioica TaxID=34765 RepID=E4Y5N8_OIKDI|nr:unnamed protein product [Oikopleura dioica]
MIVCPFLFLQILGGLCLLRFLYTQWRIISVYFFPKEFDFKGLAGDGYALITGGAEGIGKQCALYFAKKGINLILVDFNEKKLKETTKEINENFSVSVIAKVMDLTSLADPAVYDAFEKEMLKQNIAILFNNAGIAEEKRAFWNYANSTSAGISRLISINSEVVALMTKLVLPGMLERKKGVIMHMGSAAGLSSFDTNPIYAGSKAFVILFARSIRDLYPTSKTGIVHHVFYPAFIRTSLTTFITSGLKKKGHENTLESLKNVIFPTVESWFESAIKTVGNGFDNGSGGSVFFEFFANYLVSFLDTTTLQKLSDLSE